MSRDFIPMIIPTDRPVGWAEYLAGFPYLTPPLLQDNKIILVTAAETLGIPSAEINSAASVGRVEWQAPFTAGRTDPIFARLDNGPWVLQPGIRNGTPPMNQLNQTIHQAA